MEEPEKKTWKREVACVALAFWAVITVRMFWFVLAADIAAYNPLYANLTVTVWLFAAAAFGMEYFGKNLGSLKK